MNPAPARHWYTSDKWPNLAGFVLALALAGWLDWKAGDLVWGLWLSSLLVGYLTIVTTIARGIFWVERLIAKGEGLSGDTLQKLRDAKAATRAAVGEKPAIQLPPKALRLFSIPGGLFMLGFFTLHFCGFHAGHATFLSSFFPIDRVEPERFMSSFMWPPGLFHVAFTEIFPLYGGFVAAALLVEWKHIAGPKRPQLADDLPAPPAQLGRDIMVRPYKNVIRMHLLIFFFAFVHFANVDHFLVYAVVYAVYFLPWEVLRRPKPARWPTSEAE